MKYHKICKECVLNNDCLLQNHDDVENCQDVKDWEYEEMNEEEE